MFLIDSHHVRVVHNSFRRNRDLGIFVGVPGLESTRNRIQGNVLSRNGSAGIIFEGADRNRVRGNRSVRDGEGILVFTGDRNVIARNGILRAGGSGVAVEKGRGNLVARNLVARARSAGIRLGVQRPLIGGGHNTVRRNRVRDSGDDGILVNKKDGHSVLRRNRARLNGDDGFDVESHSTKLTCNGARRNRDLGIEAVPGVIDGGGNRASGNGDARAVRERELPVAAFSSEKLMRRRAHGRRAEHRSPVPWRANRKRPRGAANARGPGTRRLDPDAAPILRAGW